MRKIVLITLAVVLIGCEKQTDPRFQSLYYTVIQAGTAADPVFLSENCRKKGGPFNFSPSENNAPELRTSIKYITPEDLARNNAEILAVELTPIN